MPEDRFLRSFVRNKLDLIKLVSKRNVAGTRAKRKVYGATVAETGEMMLILGYPDLFLRSLCRHRLRLWEAKAYLQECLDTIPS